jgi:hypothetical protein
VYPEKAEARAAMSQIKIISYKDKRNWELCTKYSIGTRAR